MTKKKKLVEEAKELGIETQGKTVPQLLTDLADVKDAPLEVEDVEVLEEKKSCACEIDVTPLLSDKSMQAIANCANGLVDSKEKLEAIVRSCIVG